MLINFLKIQRLSIAFKVLSLAFLSLFIPSSLFAQDTQESPFKIRATVYSGKMMDIYAGVPPFKKSLFVECDINKQLNGNKAYHAYYGHPELGLSFQFGDWGNNNYLGQSFAVYPSMRFNIRREKTLGGYFKAGIGFAYFNKPYDLFDNPDNVFIGSHITNITTFGLGVVARPLPKIELSSGFAFLHYSNGHSRVPNVGGNFLIANISLAYSIDDAEIKHHKKYDTIEPVRFNLRIATGRHEWYGSVHPVNGPKYRVWNISPYLSKRVGAISELHWGVFATWYQQFHEYQLTKDFDEDKLFQNSLVAGFFTGHEFVINRFGGLIELGCNVYNPMFDRAHVFSGLLNKPSAGVRYFSGRAGLVYYVYKPNETKQNSIGIGLFIKSIGGKADYVEWSVNYSL